MVALKSYFDGKQIQVPDQLRGAPPGEIVIIYSEQTTKARSAAPGSIWNFYGASEHPRAAADIDAQVGAARESWDPR